MLASACGLRRRAACHGPVCRAPSPAMAPRGTQGCWTSTVGVNSYIESGQAVCVCSVQTEHILERQACLEPAVWAHALIGIVNDVRHYLSVAVKRIISYIEKEVIRVVSTAVTSITACSI